MKDELDFSDFHTFCMGVFILSVMILFYGFSFWGIYESILYPCLRTLGGTAFFLVASIVFTFKMRDVIKIVKETYPVKN